ncbi:MAG: DNRLRE domain-containing protein [Acidobacteria bacterium]|nr:DNRLRE domain-containing protein [Acidobacteriota bacterium]
MQSPIDAPGKHGATGDNAFDYFSGEGTDIAWTARGMAAGTDYSVTPESHADVVNAGWYTWDMTALVRAWVRGEQANDGVVLRDATGYEDGHNDVRAFVSSQATDLSLRPKLTVVYNPNTPHADASPDQANLSWTGGPITLDGSGSRDRPGGDNAGLTYQWRVAQAAYGSTLNGALISMERVASFTPDVPGEWDIELTVTNNVGESATDRVHLRLLSISPTNHPRIYLTPAKLATLRARAVSTNPRWVQLILIERFPDDPLARQLQAYLAATPSDDSESFFPHDEFLWFNPDQPGDPPTLLTHYSEGTGTVWMRSGWPSLTTFNENAIQYDTGDVLRFEDTARYTYVLGDATKAYNNPTYNQATYPNLSGNGAKVSRFQREFVYLRPTVNGQRSTDDYVVIFDRVGVTQAAFSGENTKLLFHTLMYSYMPTTRTLSMIFDLTPGARYRLTSTLVNGVRTVTWIRG